MKGNKVYFINFTKQIDLGEDFSHPFYLEIQELIDNGDDKYLGFTENDDIFVRLIDDQVKLFCNILRNHGFEFIVKDVTSQVLSGDVQKMYPEVHALTPGIFDIFRLEVASVDDVLDKINEKGIDSLDSIDNQILKKA